MRQLSSNLRKMYAIRFLFWMHFFASVLIPFFRDWGGITYTQIFLLNAWFMLWNFLLEVPTGTVADFFGRRVSLLLGGVVAAAGALVYASRPSFAVFLCGEVLFATSFTLMSGADEALVYDTLLALGTQGESKRVFARLESFKLAGVIAGALSGSFIATALGLRAPMLLEVVPFLGTALIAATLVEPPGGAGGKGAVPYPRLLLAGIRTFGGHRILRLLAADMIASLTLAWLIIWTYQPMLERAGVALVYFGLVHAAMCLGQIAILGNIERIEVLVGSRTRYLFLSALLPGIAFLALGLSSALPVVIVAVLVAASFGLSRPPLFISYMNKYIESENRATVLSTISMMRTLSIAAINPIAGVLADWSLPSTMLIIGSVGVVIAIAVRTEEAHLID